MIKQAPTPADELIALAHDRFPDLGPAGKKLLTATAEGKLADFGEGNPADAANWPNDRAIPAELLQWLCTNPNAVRHILPHAGIKIQGLRIDGELDLNHTTLVFSLLICRSSISCGINFLHARIGSLFFDGTHSGPIRADGIKVDGNVHLRNNFKAEGEVRLLGATVGGVLDCTKAHFANRSGKALSADGIRVDGSVCLRKVKAEGEVRFLIATIGGDLDCAKGHFADRSGKALSADGINVAGSVYLRNVKAEGEVRFLIATIGGALDCTNGHFVSESGEAISADRLKVWGSVFLENVRAEGEVRLPGATIGGNLECNEAHFANKDGQALNIEGMRVDGSVFLRHAFKAEGGVSVRGATIGGDLDCENAYFANQKGDALSADGISVNGSVSLRNGLLAQGRVSFIGATVGLSFQWRNVKSPEHAHLNLQHARVGILWDDQESWPDTIELDGFVYDRIDMKAPIDAATRINWLRRQGDDRYLPQPYEQLAKVLRNAGHEIDAKRVLIAKQKDPARLRDMSWPGRAWNTVLGETIAYGHRPFQALPFMIAIVLYGWLWFWAAEVQGGFTVTTPADRTPPFASLIYSIDAFIPIVDLHQQRFRSPAGTALRWYFYFHVAAGWTLTSLFVAGLTGLIRK